MLSGKVIVVTGGAGRLGAFFCDAITENGGAVVVADINSDGAAKVAEVLDAERKGCAEPFALDITDDGSILQLIDFCKKRFGIVDAVVNNAYPRNAGYGRKLEDVKYAGFCANVSLHLGGYFLIAQQFARFFRQQGHGNIVNMGSIYGVMTPRFSVYEGTNMTMPVEYAVIKAGVHHLTRYLAQYLKKDSIRVNTLSPGGIEDGQDKSFLDAYASFSGTKGMLEPGDVVGALLFLLSDASRFVTGQNIIVDDGFSL